MGRSPKINSCLLLHTTTFFAYFGFFSPPPFLLAGRFLGVYIFSLKPHFSCISAIALFLYLIPNVVFCTFFATHTHTHNSMSKNAVAIYIIYVFGGQKRPKKTKKFKREMIRHFFSSRFFPTFRSPPPPFGRYPKCMFYTHFTDRKSVV